MAILSYLMLGGFLARVCYNIYLEIVCSDAHWEYGKDMITRRQYLPVVVWIVLTTAVKEAVHFVPLFLFLSGHVTNSVYAFGLIGMTSCITKSAQIEGTLEELMEEENLALEELGEPIMQVDPFAAKLTLLTIYFFMQLPYLILLLTYLIFG